MTSFNDVPSRHRMPYPSSSDLPAWAAPPIVEIPGVSSGSAILVNTDEIVIAVTAFRGYTTGFAFDLMVRLRTIPLRTRLTEMMRARNSDGSVAPDVFRFGIRFADNRETTAHEQVSTNEETPGISLRLGASGGGATDWTGTYWVWPLPPTGDVRFDCSWNAYNIADATTGISAASILDASHRALVLFQ
jgi:hypothetical protein